MACIVFRLRNLISPVPLNHRFCLLTLSSPATKCPPLRKVDHANPNQFAGKGLNYGTVIRYECDPGYERSGLPTLLCQSNGTWSSDVPICVDKEPPAFRCYFIGNCLFAQFNLANSQITKPRWCYSQPHATHSGTALPTRSWCKSHPMAFSFPSTSPSPLQWITLEVLQGLTSSRRVSPFP